MSVTEWFEIVGVGAMHLWRDAPAASMVLIEPSTAALEALIEALPSTKPTENKRYSRLVAEVRTAGGVVRKVIVSLTVKNPSTSPADLCTGSGEGDWIKAGDFIRIVAIDEPSRDV